MLDAAKRDELRRTPPTPRNRLAKAMDLTGVTQTELAASTGFGQPYISRIFNGLYTDLPGETMRTLAEHFGCSIEELFPAPGKPVATSPERRQSHERRSGGRRRANRVHGHPDRRKAARR